MGISTLMVFHTRFLLEEATIALSDLFEVSLERFDDAVLADQCLGLGDRMTERLARLRTGRADDRFVRGVGRLVARARGLEREAGGRLRLEAITTGREGHSGRIISRLGAVLDEFEAVLAAHPTAPTIRVRNPVVT